MTSLDGTITFVRAIHMEIKMGENEMEMKLPPHTQQSFVLKTENENAYST